MVYLTTPVPTTKYSLRFLRLPRPRPALHPAVASRSSAPARGDRRFRCRIQQHQSLPRGSAERPDGGGDHARGQVPVRQQVTPLKGVGTCRVKYECLQGRFPKGYCGSQVRGPRVGVGWIASWPCCGATTVGPSGRMTSTRTGDSGLSDTPSCLHCYAWARGVRCPTAMHAKAGRKARVQRPAPCTAMQAKTPTEPIQCTCTRYDVQPTHC